MWDGPALITQVKLRTHTCTLRDRLTDNIYGRHIFDTNSVLAKFKNMPLAEQLSYNLINRSYYLFYALKNKPEFDDLFYKIEKVRPTEWPLLIMGGTTGHLSPFD